MVIINRFRIQQSKYFDMINNKRLGVSDFSIKVSGMPKKYLQVFNDPKVIKDDLSRIENQVISFF